MFITFEGIDGSGKTSQIRLLQAGLAAAGETVVVTREPGGSKGAEEIRALLLRGDVDRWSPETEILFFNAARRDHVERTIRPAMAAGAIVLSDRYVDSTRAYQGVSSIELLELAETLHQAAIGLDPDLTILLDIDPVVGLGRSLARLGALNEEGGAEDRFEKAGTAFQKSLRTAFLAIAKSEPDRVMVIDATGEPADVAARVLPMVLQAIASRRAQMEGSGMAAPAVG